MGSPVPPPPQVGQGIVNAGGAPPGVALSGYMGAGPGDRKLVVGHGPGPYRFQRQDPADQVHMADGCSPAKAGQ